MITAYDVAAVRAAEDAVRRTLADGELMQRAASGLADVAAARMAEEDAERVVVLAGSGDNGGDALYAAARLAEDADVTAVLVGSRAHEAALAAAQGAGVDVLEWRSGVSPADVREALASAELVIDGILGIGGRPGLPPHLSDVPDLIPEDALVLAVDLPSGLDPAGDIRSDAIFADETVTFSLAKPVHLMPATEQAIGLLTVLDIGVPDPDMPAVQRFSHTDVAGSWPVPAPGDDKYSRGVLGVITGGEHYTGAALMSVTAAVTAGVGMVRYVGPDAPTNLLRQAAPEAVFGVGRVQAWAIGSGMDVDDASPEQLSAARDALASDLPVLLDAGGLDLLERPRSAPTLLTPHAGELLRLAQRLGIGATDGGELAADDVHRAPTVVAREVADRLECTVLVKGAVTAVVPPTATGQPIHTQADGPAWLATAGSGDVLAGVCGALLAAGLDPLRAGALGALVHGVAGDRANPGGPVRAMDIAHEVGRTVAHLLRLPG
ncbi:bifunctional NAD(P)H-hydrate repair enzyme [Flexivirga endophytica]|uniref:ADP-dependent (S)-NAD(P)H-hydrate dehydratase n=1 Tax=Flexivirga endophytica TaxID=1849103 RepID=A0A916X146_9MICO|nr:bifunctional ADP-dependent NAD(P)H-hydrate dehydratase/NAD(P)H-hydrate epimerase [Flexivirga endophytica]GGB46981.1 bifunctional NAD(P)H-hydrate repair enzyme [Flexivirga endophytica]GHB67559.1 bifunctional NAD(P)H-hydrate repair enzyme [Flexivirga endophytica]